jgi:V8-like Glu-specific endopeptidase
MRLTFFAVAAFAALAVSPARADEGMWTFDNFPSAAMKAKHGFAPDQAWLDRVRQSAVRLSSGCSASTVSPNGLVLTNWHCVSDCVQALSSKQDDFAAEGFLAARAEDEKTCPGMQAEILMSISDVTTRVKAAIAGKAAADVAKARQGEIARIEEEGCKADKKLQCEVVSLYRGGQYKLYTYRKYEDVRLAFAPETSTGFFGGDPDNFNFPRFCLDSAMLRLYEDGKPVATPTHLAWTTDVPKEGEPVFVAGNPGSTQRLYTKAQLEFDRDWQLPTRQLIRSELRGRLLNYASQGAEAKRTSADIIFSIENSFKAQYGQQRALLDPEFFATKVAEETSLRARLKKNASLAREIGDPWADMEKVVAAQRELYMSHDWLQARAGSISQLYGHARLLVRAAEERAKPNADRLPGFTDSDIPQLERQMKEQVPVYSEVERIGLELWLSKTREFLTVDDLRVQRLLGKEGPEAIAEAAIKGTKLGDANVRLALWNGGKAAVDASRDPLIVLARRAEADSREVLKAWRERVEGPAALASERLARARFALDGDKVYPDATFTLRLSYGTVAGWTYNGRTIAPYSTVEGLYARATGAEPFALAPKWLAAESSLNKSTVFNLTSTNDIIGGNSGSPLIDAKGRVVGAVFDGNIHSLGGGYGYDARTNRTVSVSTAAISEALRKVYKADRLADELGVK